jgi:hypothetical protein
MLARSAPLPTRGAWAFEPKWDGFRALVASGDRFRVRSRRGWDMTPLLPEFEALPPGLVLDGELVAFRERRPHFPLVCRRLVERDASVPLVFVAFDLLAHDGESLLSRTLLERRALLEALELGPGPWCLSPVYDDGPALFQAVCGHGLEGVVCKPLTSRYLPGERGWLKVKNRLAYQAIRNVAAARALAAPGQKPVFALLYDERNPYFAGAGNWPGWPAALREALAPSEDRILFRSVSWQELGRELPVDDPVATWAREKHDLRVGGSA